MRLQWKEFMVSLPMFEKYLKDTLGSDYLGYVTNESGYTIGIDPSVSQAQRDAIKAQWDGITNESDEATNYRDKEWFKAQRASMKAAAFAKSWDAMTVVERKLIGGEEVTPLEILGIE